MLVKPLLAPFDHPPYAPAEPVAVVIPAYNNAATIARCIESLRAQEGVATAIVVVDDASTDDTAAVAERTGARVIRRATNGGPAAARNQGARETSGDVLFFAEADGYYAPDYLRVCLRALGDERVGASLALGVRGWTERDNVVVRLSDAQWIVNHSLVAAGQRGTGAWCYRREVFQRLGGFDETRLYGEDVDLARRVETLGLRTGVAGWSVLYHRNPDTLRLWWRRAYWGATRDGQTETITARRALSQLMKTMILMFPPIGVALALLHHWWWIAPALAVVIAPALEDRQIRRAQLYLWRTRRWLTLTAVPGLMWLRRLAFATGRLQGWLHKKDLGQRV